MKVKNWILFSCVTAITMLYGCARLTPEAFKAQVESQVPPAMVGRKIDLKVVVIVPDASRTRTRLERLPGPCGPPLPGWPYGDIFVKTVEDGFSKLYERVGVSSNRMNVGESEAVFEAELTGLSAKPSCPAQQNAIHRAEGTLRAVDFNGVEIWRSRVQSKDVRTEGFTDHEESDREGIFGAIRGLVSDWVKELESLPTERYARRSGQQKVVPVPSSQPVPPPIY